VTLKPAEAQAKESLGAFAGASGFKLFGSIAKPRKFLATRRGTQDAAVAAGEE